GNHHGVRGDQLVQAVRGVNGVPRRAWHRPGGGGADGEAVSLGLPAVAENLRRYSQVEGLDGRQREGGHGMHDTSLREGSASAPLTPTRVSQIPVSTGSRYRIRVCSSLVVTRNASRSGGCACAGFGMLQCTAAASMVSSPQFSLALSHSVITAVKLSSTNSLKCVGRWPLMSTPCSAMAATASGCREPGLIPALRAVTRPPPRWFSHPSAIGDRALLPLQMNRTRAGGPAGVATRVPASARPAPASARPAPASARPAPASASRAGWIWLA